jgi:hypothetical protein
VSALIFPAIKREAIALYGKWALLDKPTILIEDAGSGTSLLQELHDLNIPCVGIRPEGDKKVRMSGQSAKVDARAVHLPRSAAWLGDLHSPSACMTTKSIRFRKRWPGCLGQGGGC